MSDICHSDFCPDGNSGELEDCLLCVAVADAQQAYYGALYASEPHYTDDELRDAYSHPSDRHKLISLIGEQG